MLDVEEIGGGGGPDVSAVLRRLEAGSVDAQQLIQVVRHGVDDYVGSVMGSVDDVWIGVT